MRRVEVDMNAVCWQGDAIRASRRRHSDVARGDVVLLTDGPTEFMATAAEVDHNKIYFLVDWDWA